MHLPDDDDNHNDSDGHEEACRCRAIHAKSQFSLLLIFVEHEKTSQQNRPGPLSAYQRHRRSELLSPRTIIMIISSASSAAADRVCLLRCLRFRILLLELEAAGAITSNSRRPGFVEDDIDFYQMAGRIHCN